jgi:hypothetical protein
MDHSKVIVEVASVKCGPFVKGSPVQPNKSMHCIYFEP